MKVKQSILSGAFWFFAMSVWSQSLDEQFQQLAENNNLVGMSVLVTCGMDIDYSYHYGLRNIQDNSPITPETRYRIASISKTVTAMGVMKLWEDGLLNLSGDISDYLGFTLRNPNYPEDPITVGHLLSHQSGIIDGSGYSAFLTNTYNASPVPGIDELLLAGGSFYTSDMFTNTEPGSYFNYSNINYGLLGTIIEGASGMRFDVFMRTQILEPLGIGGSFNIQDIEEIDNIATLYRNSTPQADDYQGEYPSPLDLSDYEPGTNGLIFAPQGGLRVNTIELSRIMRTLYNRGNFSLNIPGEELDVELLSDETVEEMLEPRFIYDGSNGNNYFNLFNSWGLGLHITTNNLNGDIVLSDEIMFGHPGEAYGLLSDMYFGDDIGLIFLTNGYYFQQGYEFGDNSSFYSVEEEAFEIIEDNFLDCQAVGIHEHTESDIRLFPNPSDDYVQIEIKEDILLVRLYDLSGKPIREWEKTDNLDLKKIDAGVYLLECVSLSGYSYLTRLIKY